MTALSMWMEDEACPRGAGVFVSLETITNAVKYRGNDSPILQYNLKSNQVD
jgi:hypothetical protein